MRIAKDYSEIKNLSVGDVLATPGFLCSQSAKDWGYFIEGNLVLPFYIKKKFIFEYMVFPTSVYGINYIEEESAFLESLVRYLKKELQIDFILSQHVTALFNTYPAHSIYCRFGSYILDLSQNEEVLLTKIHSKHRNVIKKAEKDGVVISCDSKNRSRCIDLIQKTLKRQHVPLINQEVWDRFNKIKNVDYWLAEYNGKIEGSAIILWGENNKAYYMYGGSSVKPHAGAMNLLHWEAIKKMKERNVLYYDFVGARINPKEGSKYEGIQRFKSRFGGDLQEGYLWKYILNKFKYRLFCFLLFARSMGKYTGDIIDQERKRNSF
ncbi:MAG: peptidoglycan bridge formation glycyltransferase FemA/FemB family protein [Bacteroidales bacterium]